MNTLKIAHRGITDPKIKERLVDILQSYDQEQFRLLLNSDKDSKCYLHYAIMGLMDNSVPLQKQNEFMGLLGRNLKAEDWLLKIPNISLKGTQVGPTEWTLFDTLIWELAQNSMSVNESDLYKVFKLVCSDKSAFNCSYVLKHWWYVQCDRRIERQASDPAKEIWKKLHKIYCKKNKSNNILSVFSLLLKMAAEETILNDLLKSHSQYDQLNSIFPKFLEHRNTICSELIEQDIFSYFIVYAIKYNKERSLHYISNQLQKMLVKNINSDAMSAHDFYHALIKNEQMLLKELVKCLYEEPTIDSQQNRINQLIYRIIALTVKLSREAERVTLAKQLSESQQFKDHIEGFHSFLNTGEQYSSIRSLFNSKVDNSSISIERKQETASQRSNIKLHSIWRKFSMEGIVRGLLSKKMKRRMRPFKQY